MIDSNNNNEYKHALTVALKYLNHKDRTEYEIYERLLKEECSENVIAQTISYLKEQGYVNDIRYAEYYYICYGARRSIKRIRTELLSKGLEQHIIDSIEETMDTLKDNQYEAVGRALKKQFNKRRISDNDDISYEEKCAIKASLYRQGFSSEIISEIFRV